MCRGLVRCKAGSQTGKGGLDAAKMGTVKRYLAAERLDVSLKLMLVVVTQLTPEEVDDIKSRLTGKRFPDSPVNIDIHFFDFEDLQQTYVTTDG